MEEEKKFTIYLHRCPNGKCYVGMTSQTTNQRWRNGYGYKNNKDFYPDIEKYGWDNIEHIILEEGLNREDACESEKYNIKKYDCIYPNGYNIAIGGDLPWNFGKPWSIEIKTKMRNAQLGEKSHAYGKRGKESYSYGRKCSEQQKQILSNMFKGENNPNYGNHKLKGENHFYYNKTFSKEHCENISIGKKLAFINNPETKPIGIKNGMYGKKHSKEFIEKYCFSHNLKKVYASRDDIWFDSIKECSKYYNINYTYLSSMLKGKQKMNAFVDDLKLYINGIELEYEKSDISKNHSKRIVCENIIFNSVMECANYYGVVRTCISATLKNMDIYKKGKWLDRGLRYYNPETDSHLPIYVDTKDEV